MRKFFILTVFLTALNCADYINEPKPAAKKPTYADTLAVLDTAHFDSLGNLMPPCSMSPDYCRCMAHRGARIGEVPGCKQ